MPRSQATPYDWNVIDQVCREKIKASEAVRRWDGLIVSRNHPGCFEHRHPLDMPQRLPPEPQPLPFTSPEGPDVEIVVPYITTAVGGGESSIVGEAVVGLAVVGSDGGATPVLDTSGVPTGTFDSNNKTL